MGKKRNPFGKRLNPPQKPSKLVGGFLPLQLADYVCLLAVYHGQSVQSEIHDAVVGRVALVGKSEGQIIEALVEEAACEWRERVAQGRSKADVDTRARYMQEIEASLRRRKVSEPHKAAIMSALIGSLQ